MPNTLSQKLTDAQTFVMAIYHQVVSEIMSTTYRKKCVNQHKSKTVHYIHLIQNARLSHKQFNHT